MYSHDGTMQARPIVSVFEDTNIRTFSFYENRNQGFSVVRGTIQV